MVEKKKGVASKKAVIRSDIMRVGGGILLLLPTLLYSHNSKGLSFSHTATDNLYLLDMRESGSIMGISPFWEHGGFFDFRWDGNLSAINFEGSNLFLENHLRLHKKAYLPGVGNKNTMYLSFYSFVPTSHDIYQHTDFALGDSLNVYLESRYLFSPEVKLKYIDFHSDSLKNYLEPRIKSSISIPLPYFFFTPRISTGVKIYEQERLPFYQAGADFYFPLITDFSLTLSLSHYYLGLPENEYHIPASHADDPFFEMETIHKMSELKILPTKLFLDHYSQLDLDLRFFEKSFFEIDNTPRRDRGLGVNIRFTKLLDENVSFFLQLESLSNSSTIQDFEYTRNSVDLCLELAFQ